MGGPDIAPTTSKELQSKSNHTLPCYASYIYHYYNYMHRYIIHLFIVTIKQQKKVRSEQFEFTSLMKYTNSNNNSNAFLPPSKVILVA